LHTPTRTGHPHTYNSGGQKPWKGLGLDAFGPWHYKGLTSKNLIKVKAKRKTTDTKKWRWCPWSGYTDTKCGIIQNYS